MKMNLIMKVLMLVKNNADDNDDNGDGNDGEFSFMCDKEYSWWNAIVTRKVRSTALFQTVI